MQSLISQITSLFATQSINSLENNGLGLPLVSGQEFSNVFDGLINDNNTANLAIFNGQALPPASYTPISFQISQLTLTSQPSQINGDIDIQGEVVQANVTPQSSINYSLHGSADIEHRIDNPVNLADQSTVTASTNVSDKVNNHILPTYREYESKSTATSTLFNDKSNLSQTIEEGRFDNNRKSRDQAIFNEQGVGKHSINESMPRLDANLKQVQSKTFNESGNLSKNSTLNAVVNNYDISIDKVANRNIILNQDVNQKNVEVNIDNKGAAQVINSNSKATQYTEGSTSTTKNSIDSLSGLGVPSDESNPIRNDVLLRGDKNNIEKESQIDKNVDIKNQFSNLPNGQSLSASRDVVQAGQSNTSEVDTSNKPIYNLNQYDEAKRSEISYRGDRAQINYGLDQSSAVNDKGVSVINQSVQSADNTLELNTSLAKGQELAQDIKPPVEKPLINTLSTDPLSASNKLSPLDKSPLPVANSNSVSNGEELAQQITWAKNNSANHVKIALSPEHLGALEISIDQDRDGLNIQFTTQNATAKEAIETFMPRLKDMLEQQGLNLQNANVSQQDSGSYSDTYEQESEHYNQDAIQDDGQNVASAISENSSNSSDRLLEAFA